MAPAASIAEEHRRCVERVLLVDDHEMYLKYCSRDFVRAGVAVFSTHTLRGARDIVRKERPDIAIVDLFLTPPENGLDVIRAIKNLDPTVFCILVSAHMSVTHALMGVRAGADDVYTKPLGARQLLARVERGVIDEPQASAVPTLHEVEWEHISRVLYDHEGNISQAAESLGIFRQSLQRKIAKYAPRVLAADEEAPPYPILVPKPPAPPPEPVAPPPKPRRTKPALNKAAPKKAAPKKRRRH